MKLPDVSKFAVMSAADLRAAFEPRGLCPNGFNNVAGERAENWERYESSAARGEELVRQVTRAAEWLELCGQRVTINRASTSYGLKHEAERWCGAYICNGALLMAAYGLGFRVQRPDGHRNFPNGYLNISKRRPGVTNNSITPDLRTILQSS